MKSAMNIQKHYLTKITKNYFREKGGVNIFFLALMKSTVYTNYFFFVSHQLHYHKKKNFKSIVHTNF